MRAGSGICLAFPGMPNMLFRLVRLRRLDGHFRESLKFVQVGFNGITPRFERDHFDRGAYLQKVGVLVLGCVAQNPIRGALSGNFERQHAKYIYQFDHAGCKTTVVSVQSRNVDLKKRGASIAIVLDSRVERALVVIHAFIVYGGSRRLKFSANNMQQRWDSRRGQFSSQSFALSCFTGTSSGDAQGDNGSRECRKGGGPADSDRTRQQLFDIHHSHAADKRHARQTECASEPRARFDIPSCRLAAPRVQFSHDGPYLFDGCVGNVTESAVGLS